MRRIRYKKRTLSRKKIHAEMLDGIGFEKTGQKKAHKCGQNRAKKFVGNKRSPIFATRFKKTGSSLQNELIITPKESEIFLEKRKKNLVEM